jgi:hypothetical protein
MYVQCPTNFNPENSKNLASYIHHGLSVEAIKTTLEVTADSSF